MPIMVSTPDHPGDYGDGHLSFSLSPKEPIFVIPGTATAVFATRTNYTRDSSFLNPIMVEYVKIRQLYVEIK